MIKVMKRSLRVFVFFLFCFGIISSLNPISAYWTTMNDLQENSPGVVLGWQSVKSNSNYFYVVGPAPKILTATPWLTNAPTVTVTPTPTSGINTNQSYHQEDNNNSSNSSSSSSSSHASNQNNPAATSTPQPTEPSGSGGPNWQWVDPAPTAISNHPSPTSPFSFSSSSSSSKSSSDGPNVTGTPYPTRSSGLSVITTPGINMPSAHDLINPPVSPPDSAGPTPIPDELRGGIFIVPTPTPNKTTVTVPEQIEESPVFVPGHTIVSIDIKTPVKEIGAGSSSGSGIDIQVNKTDGSGLNANEEQFVIQKAMQRITISADTTNNNSLSISKNDVKARISMGIQIDPLTNTLTVDTPNGKQRVSIMPDDALNIIRELKLIEQNILPGDIVLESRNGQLAYKIPASKIQKLLGMIPLSIPKDVYIAADTGGIVEIHASAFYNFITLFTF